MKLLLMTLTCLCAARASGAGENRVICPTESIEAVEGDDVTLQCRLDPPVNIVNYTIAWRRVDLNKVVHFYRHEQDHNQQQMEQYKDRTTLDRDDLSRGVLTLRISSANLSDSGLYRFFVPKLKAGGNITITVGSENKSKAGHAGANYSGTGIGIGIGIGIIILCVFILALVLKSAIIKKCRGWKETEAAEGGEDQEGHAEDHV